MITLSKRTSITKQQHIVSFEISENIPEGEYEALLVLDEVSVMKKRPLVFRTSDLNIDPFQTFRREDIYNDDGR